MTIVLENLEGIKFIAVHYRFDKDDWMKHCSESTAVNPACEKVIDILNDIPKDRIQRSFDPNWPLDYLDQMTWFNNRLNLDKGFKFSCRLCRIPTRAQRDWSSLSRFSTKRNWSSKRIRDYFERTTWKRFQILFVNRLETIYWATVSISSVFIIT